MTARSARDVQNFDLRALPDSFSDDPYPTYAALRRDDPVHKLPGEDGYLLTRYADIISIYRDPRCSSDKTEDFRPRFADGPLYEHHTTSLVFNDPPLHTRIRSILVAALSPRALESMVPGLEALVERLLDDIEAQGAFDLIDDFAAAIPVEVIGNLLSIPHADRGPLRRWSLDILGALEPSLSAEALARGEQSVREFLSYLEGLVADRRAHMKDPDEDVLSRLILGDADGEELTHKELLHNCIFLLNAGHETTANLIGNGSHALLTHPGERDRLRADPALITTAVEELLRFESPLQLNNRITAAPIEVGGVSMPKGTRITLAVAAANRDPAMFAEPDRLDIARTRNRHLAFGHNAHTCAGLSLARLEGRIALGRLFARFPELRLAGAPLRDPRVRFRGFQRLPAQIS